MQPTRQEGPVNALTKAYVVVPDYLRRNFEVGR